MRTFTLTNATVFTGETTYEDCSLTVEGGKVAQFVLEGKGSRKPANAIDVQGRRLAPGFVDLQVNGGGGVLFNNAPTVDSLRIIAKAHARYGTTAFLPTLISDHFEVMRAGLEAVRAAQEKGVTSVLGIHLEGPFLNPQRRGAHDAKWFRTIDEDAIALVTSLGSDLVTLLTLAPEMTTPDVVRRLCDAGIIVFAGHSAATYEECRAAVQEGMSGFTHLFNGMSPMTSREPGVVGAALTPGDSFFSIIADGHHVNPDSLRIALSVAGRDRGILITDAMPTVGSKDKSFDLYGQRLRLKEGVLRDGRDSLAGSHLTMMDAVRNVMQFAQLSWCEAIRMASSNPAHALGLENQYGYIRPGYPANFVELDEDLNLIRTWIGGVPFIA